MKRTYFRMALILIAVSALTLSSCKKKETTAADDVYSAQDNNNATQHLNASVDDAATAAGNTKSLAGKTNGPGIVVAGATIDYSDTAHGVITVTYDGTTTIDGSFKRSGTMKLTLEGYAAGTRWRDAGAVLDIDFTALVVTNFLTGAHIRYDGNNKLMNVSGGLAYRLLNGDTTGTVTHRHTASNVSITFDNGSQRTWSVDRTRTFNRAGTTLTITLTGNATQGGYSNVDAWGTNRNGVSFVNQISTPIVYSNSCSNYRNANSGQITHYVNNKTLTVIFGVDLSGAVSTATCPYGYQVTYSNGTRSISRVIQYWH